MLLEFLVRGRRFTSVESIDAFRQIRVPPRQPEDRESDAGRSKSGGDLNGVGLVENLQALERPDIAHLADKKKFEKITEFVRSVLDDHSATIEIPSHAREVYVTRRGRTLPLDRLGTGIHEVVILAAAATLIEDRLVCIEEPEIHLHPLLQRKLIRYLDRNTSNQYLIATHSAHMLDRNRSSIFHITNDGERTMATQATTSHAVSTACTDLGYRASDLLQANSVIWVEGPSDRVYLQHWIHQIDPDLIEGIDYSIMFYGGRLLNHLSADDDDVKEFISLRHLNRHSSIMIDSDKEKPQQQLNATKRRIQRSYDADDSPGYAWITNGRTIENYIPRELLTSSIVSLIPGAHPAYTGDKWEDPLALKMVNNAKPKRVDKVKLSRLVCGDWHLDQMKSLDLLTQVNNITSMIHSANDHRN